VLSATPSTPIGAVDGVADLTAEQILAYRDEDRR
jgi:hypothetical protein